LLTTFKEQLTFKTQLYNQTNAATFKAVGLEELVELSRKAAVLTPQ